MTDSTPAGCAICTAGEWTDGKLNADYAPHFLLPDGQCPVEYQAWLYRHFTHMCVDMPRHRALARLVELRRSWAAAVRHRSHPDARRKLVIVARVIEGLQCQL